MSKTVAIPYDVYESQTHLLCIIPMWWVEKNSVSIKLRDYSLHISAKRNRPDTGDEFLRIQQECYRWDVNCLVDLPTRIDYDNIESTLSKENILTILIPKKDRIDNTIPVMIEG